MQTIARVGFVSTQLEYNSRHFKSQRIKVLVFGIPTANGRMHGGTEYSSVEMAVAWPRP